MAATDKPILFHIDCNVWMYKYNQHSRLYRPADEPLTADLIHRYVDVIADSGVNVLVVHCSTQLPWYPSKQLPTILDGYERGDRSFLYGQLVGWPMTPAEVDRYMDETVHMLDGYLDLIEAGVDWLAETAAACRRRGVSPWVSVRMNDLHGNPRCIEGSYFHCDLYRDPAMRLHKTQVDPTAPPGAGHGFNFEQQQVRDHMLDLIRDPVENYEYEGLILDWARQPLCCEPNADEPTTRMITDWHGTIRELTQRRARGTGKPYPLGIRYFGTLDQLRNVGLDISGITRRGFVDFVSPSNSWQTSWAIPCDELRRELAPNTHVHGVIELGPNWVHGYCPDVEGGSPHLGMDQAISYRLSAMCPPILRGNAAAKLVLGVDCVELYNFPCADAPSHWPWQEPPCAAAYEAVTELADLAGLRGKSKLYTWPSLTGYYADAVFEVVSPFPCILSPGERRAARIPMAAEPADTSLELVIQVIVKQSDDLPPVGISFNGRWPTYDSTETDLLLFPIGPMTHHRPGYVAYEFAMPIGTIREGWNEIFVVNGKPADFWNDQSGSTLPVENVELAVR